MPPAVSRRAAPGRVDMRGYNGLSVCQYFSEERAGGLRFLHFVYEPEPFNCTGFETADCYYLYLVAEGGGELKTEHEQYELEKGSFFFLFPGRPYYFTGRGWKLVWLSFRGAGVEKLYSDFGITYQNCTRSGYAPLVREWLREFNRSRANRSAALVAEALLLKTLSYFGGPAERGEDSDPRRALADLVARWLDENFQESGITLAKLGELFHFHPNYMSSTFKEYMHTGIAAYLRQKRLHRACELLSGSDMLVKDVALSVGYEDALYFERCFRKYVGRTPTEYREGERRRKSAGRDAFLQKFYL